MDRIILFPGSLSSSRLDIMLKELEVGVPESKVDVVDIFNWENLEPNHLRLSSTGSVPVLVTVEGVPLTGENIYQHLNQMKTAGPVCVYPRESEMKVKVEGFQRKLDQINIGIVTYGLAFHLHKTIVLRHPYHDEEYFEQSSNYILNRADRLRDAAEMIRAENPEICAQLRILADEHQENLPYYLEAEGYDGVLSVLDKVLDFFEEELGQDDRQGKWLGGGQLCVADITLGLYLYRLQQLGLDSVYYQEGIRPHLSVFFQGILKRNSFKEVLKWEKYESISRKILSDEDKAVENAKWGLGIAAVVGGLFMARKFLKK